MNMGKGNSIPPKVTKKMSLMYLLSVYKFLKKSKVDDPDVSIDDLLDQIEDTLEKENIDYVNI